MTVAASSPTPPATAVTLWPPAGASGTRKCTPTGSPSPTKLAIRLVAVARPRIPAVPVDGDRHPLREVRALSSTLAPPARRLPDHGAASRLRPADNLAVTHHKRRQGLVGLPASLIDAIEGVDGDVQRVDPIVQRSRAEVDPLVGQRGVVAVTQAGDRPCRSPRSRGTDEGGAGDW